MDLLFIYGCLQNTWHSRRWAVVAAKQLISTTQKPFVNFEKDTNNACM